MEGPSREERIRQVAYMLWENSGRVHGQDVDHWLEAIRLVDQDAHQGRETPPPLVRVASSTGSR
ncbi:MAG: DUF2934 domain-containing protein [Magnetococcales bacterium]|nr:DUF2934 domain-containing protein [Magnetococcales bacterium]